MTAIARMGLIVAVVTVSAIVAVPRAGAAEFWESHEAAVLASGVEAIEVDFQVLEQQGTEMTPVRRVYGLPEKGLMYPHAGVWRCSPPEGSTQSCITESRQFAVVPFSYKLVSQQNDAKGRLVDAVVDFGPFSLGGSPVKHHIWTWSEAGLLQSHEVLDRDAADSADGRQDSLEAFAWDEEGRLREVARDAMHFSGITRVTTHATFTSAPDGRPLVQKEIGVQPEVFQGWKTVTKYRYLAAKRGPGAEGPPEEVFARVATRLEDARKALAAAQDASSDLQWVADAGVYPDDAIAHGILCLLAIIRGDAAGAKDHVDKATLLAPDLPETSAVRARFLFATGDRTGATEAIVAMVEGDPEDDDLRTDAAAFYVQAQMAEQAAHQADVVVGRSPERGQAWVLLAVARAMLGETKPACEALASAISLGVPDLEPLNAQLGCAKAAEAASLEVRRSELLARARSEAVGGAVDQAIATLDELLAKDPEAAEAWALKGSLRAENGDKSGCLDLRRAEQLGYREARELLMKLNQASKCGR